jgi:hypothetical protein
MDRVNLTTTTAVLHLFFSFCVLYAFFLDIHHEYKFALLDLSVEFLDESSQQPINRQSNAMNPACHASSVSV